MGEPRGVGLNPFPGLGAVSYPFWSGKEDLAEFGAYRNMLRLSSAPLRTSAEDTIDSTR